MIDKIIEQLWQAAEQNLERDGELIPMVFGLKGQQLAGGSVIGDATSDGIFHAVELIKREHDPDYIILITEAWMAVARPGETLENPGLRPSERHDRQEAIVISVTGRVTARMYTRRFTKKDGVVVWLGEREDHAELQGRYVDLMQKGVQ